MKRSRHPLDCPFPHAFRFKGGSTPPPPPPPIPPVTESSTDVAQAQAQQKRDAAKRQGYASTLLAGETGGTKDQQKTLLG
jgi:hypothetical protein